jgi:hypothetical protein
MQEYPIKRGLTKDVDARIVTELKNCFGVDPEKTTKGYRIKSGALKRLDVSVGTTPTEGSGNTWTPSPGFPPRNA